jgi:uncharacterized protein YfaA (DUF2138 family)
MKPRTPWRAWHGLVGRDDPLNSLSEGRQLAHLNEMKELLAGDIGAHPARHHAGEVSGELGTQAVAAMWRRKNSELKGQAQGRKEANIKQSPEPALDARF